MDVLNVNEDKHSKRTSPHQKLTEHLVQVAAKLIYRITSSATRSQRIYVITADVHATVMAFQLCNLQNVIVYINQVPVYDATQCKNRESHGNVYINSNNNYSASDNKST